MNTAKVKAYAKLNLSLAVTGKENGYHLLDSFVCSIDLCDHVTLKKRKDSLINVYMRGEGSEDIPPEKNNAVKAAEAFVSRFHTAGADITIVKDIPMGAGLGGSSADAAGVLNGMAKLYQKEGDPALKEIADSLGSDTGYMLTGGFARLTGRGEKVQPFPSGETLHFLLILPSTPVSTAACYQKCDETGVAATSDEIVAAFLRGDKAAMGARMQNDLYAPAAALNPDVAKALEEARSFSPLGAAMTGSGSAVFAFFENAEFCAWAKSRYKGKFKTEIVKSVVPKGEKFLVSPFALTEEEIKQSESATWKKD